MQALTSQSPAYFSFPQQWNAQDLTDAMPRHLRLSQMVDFDAVRAGAADSANANTPARKPRVVLRGYARNVELPLLFRIR
ncbi:MAG: hypothetical protein L0H23_06190 [Luteimonas sp.]|nr:hypothetical protein [Luteimonas sp.]